MHQLTEEGHLLYDPIQLRTSCGEASQQDPPLWVLPNGYPVVGKPGDQMRLRIQDGLVTWEILRGAETITVYQVAARDPKE